MAASILCWIRCCLCSFVRVRIVVVSLFVCSLVGYCFVVCVAAICIVRVGAMEYADVFDYKY